MRLGLMTSVYKVTELVMVYVSMASKTNEVMANVGATSR